MPAAFGYGNSVSQSTSDSVNSQSVSQSTSDSVNSQSVIQSTHRSAVGMSRGAIAALHTLSAIFGHFLDKLNLTAVRKHRSELLSRS